MGSNNTYTIEDSLLAYTMFRNKKMEIGLWDIKRIAQVSGHSIDSLRMKVDAFKGITNQRHLYYVEGRDDRKAGLNRWAKIDENVIADYKTVSTSELMIIAKRILAAKFKTYQSQN